MSIEAMKQALEALRCIESPLQVWEITKLGGAMNALREAIAEAEKQKPVAWDDRALMQMALDAFEAMINEGWSYCGPERTSKAQTASYEATLALRERLADHTRSEKLKEAGYTRRPKKWSKEDNVDWEAVAADQAMTIAMMTLESKREWVGLTDEDIYKVIEENIPPQLNTLFDMAKWVSGVVEAKLKEKNT